MLGFYVTGHPLDSYEEKIAELATHDTRRSKVSAKGVEVALCGMITGMQRKRNREGKPWASIDARRPQRARSKRWSSRPV